MQRCLLENCLHSVPPHFSEGSGLGHAEPLIWILEAAPEAYHWFGGQEPFFTGQSGVCPGPQFLSSSSLFAGLWF